MENSWGFMTCEKVDRMANWVGTSVASAFFLSLERCACINLSTSHDDLDEEEEEEEEEAKDRPLMLANLPSLDCSSLNASSDKDKIPPV